MSTAELPAPRHGLLSPRLLDRARSTPIELWLLGALTVAAAVIRLLVIDNQSLWFDESLTAHEVRLPFGAMLNFVSHEETTPPLYFIVVWIWAHVFGDGEVSLRMVSTLTGTALVPVCYVCGKELASRRAGLIAAALVTVNPFMVWYSQEARSYMLLTFLCGLSFLWFSRARAQPSRRNVLWWAGLSCLAITTHFFAGFLVAPEALWLLWVARTRLVALAVAACGVVQLAMLPLAVVDTGHGTTWIGRIDHLIRLSQAIAEWGVSIMYRREHVVDGLVGGVTLGAVVVALVLASRDQRTRVAAKVSGGIAAAVWLVPFWVGFLGHDYFLSRNVMPAAVPLAVLLGVAFAAPRARWLGGGALAVLLALFSWAAIRVQTHPYLERPNWRSVAHALGSPARTRAILVSGGTNADPMTIYLAGVGWEQPHRLGAWVGEIDVVGATKRLSLLPMHVSGSRSFVEEQRKVPRSGASLPVKVPPPRAILITRFRIHNWVVARYLLVRPMHVSVGALPLLAPLYFERTPRDLLSVIQPRSR